jgi:citrate synthase
MKKRKLYGFGNRIYKNFDPRAKIIQKVNYQLFKIANDVF